MFLPPRRGVERDCGSGFVTLCNMLNWILMNCVCGMMLHAAVLVPLFRLYDKADVRLDCAALARTLCDPVTAAHLCSNQAFFFPDEVLPVKRQKQRNSLFLSFLLDQKKITSMHLDIVPQLPTLL